MDVPVVDLSPFVFKAHFVHEISPLTAGKVGAAPNLGGAAFVAPPLLPLVDHLLIFWNIRHVRRVRHVLQVHLRVLFSFTHSFFS